MQRLALALVVSAGCISTGPRDTDQSGSGSSDDTSSESEAGSELGSEVDTGDSTDGGDLPQWIDQCICNEGCDPFDPGACSEGMKCAPSYSEGIALPAFQCTDIVGIAAKGEPCEKMGGQSYFGSDDCIEGLVCVEVDGGIDEPPNLGWCAELCDEDLAPCGAAAQCVPSPLADFSTCRPLCDPLSNDCPNVDAETPPTHCGFGVDPGFVCQGASTGAATQGEACVLPTDCADAHLCLSGAVVGPSVCGQHAGCCAQLCDTQMPACDAGLTCVAVFMPGQAPGYDTLGYCQGI